MDHHYAEATPALPVVQPVRREVFADDGARDDEEPDSKTAKVEHFSKAGAKPPPTGIISEPTEPYPLEEPCYQRLGKQANSLYAGAALTPPLREIHWPVGAAKAEDLPKASNATPIGGLRHLAPTIRRLPVLAYMGGVVYSALDEWLNSESDGGKAIISEVLSIVGSTTITKLRRAVSGPARRILFAALKPHAPNALKNLTQPTQDSPANTELLHLWVCASQDPDELPVEWLRHGAPAGIERPIVSRGIFPEYDPTEDLRTVDPE